MRSKANGPDSVARAFGAWLTERGLRYARARYDAYGRRGRDGGPWIFVITTQPPNLCVLFKRSDRYCISKAQENYLQYLQQCGWKTAIAFELSDAQDAVNRLSPIAGAGNAP